MPRGMKARNTSEIICSVEGCKPLRDEIAKLIGRDDAERYGIEWQYEQAKTPFHKIEIYEVRNANS